MAFSTPLTVVSGVNDFDESEDLFLTKYRDNSLILIEDASDVVREFLQNGRLERMLKIISNGTDGYYPCGIITAKFNQTKDDVLSKKITNIKYQNIECQEQNRKSFGLIELHLHDGRYKIGGHFCAYVKNKLSNKVIIFDPMNFTSNNTSYGFYYPVFEYIASKFFNCEVKSFSLINSPDECFQLTGGFPATNGNPEEYQHDENSENALQRYNEYTQSYDKETINYMIEYGPDSQNHFCYMWSICWLHWYLGANINRIEIPDLAMLRKQMNENDLIPVSFIKNYIMKWITNYFENELINTTVCEKGTLGKKIFEFQKGYLYEFIKIHFPKTLYWSISSNKNNSYNVVSGPAYRKPYRKPYKKREDNDVSMMPVFIYV